MPPWSWILLLTAAGFDWYAVGTGKARLKYVTKPLVLLCLVFLVGYWSGFTYPFLLMGLAFSLLGDVLLMLPGRFFLLGLAAFLLTHISYTVEMLISIEVHSPWMILAQVPLLTGAGLLFATLNKSIRQAIGTRRIRGAVLLYSIAITGMLCTALAVLFAVQTSLRIPYALFIGAALFYLSDNMLAFDRFIRPFRSARLAVRTTYHTGQFLIVLAFLGFL